ncbi:MAG: hypothetical protein AB9835_01775 [Eubacteriales bacterium]
MSIRYNVAYSLYSDIAIDHFYIANEKLDYYNELSVKDKNKYHEIYFSLTHEIESNYIISICFSAMSLESFIYDYTAKNLGDNYVDKHLDKLDAVSKWLIIPTLVTNKTLSKDEKTYCYLTECIKSRNNYIHIKSKNLDLDNIKQIENIEKMTSYEVALKVPAHKSLVAIFNLMTWLDSIDDNAHAVFNMGISRSLSAENDEKWKKIINTIQKV